MPHRWMTSAHQRRRGGGAADEDVLQAHALRRIVQVVDHQRDPQGGHALRHARQRGGDDLRQPRRRQIGAGEDHRRAAREVRQRNAPAQHMVDGHAAQPRGAVRNGEGVRGAQVQAVQVQRPVRVDDALRRALRAGRVTHRGTQRLVEFRPVVGGRAAVEKRFVGIPGHAIRQVRGGLLHAGGADDDHRAHARAFRQHAAQALRQGGVADDDLVVGVIDDVHDLVVHQLLVQRLEHRAHRRHAQEHLQVLGAVVHQGADALVAVDAQLVAQRIGQRRGAGGHGREGGGLRAVRVPRRHLGVRVDGASVLEDPRHGKRDVLHRAAHAYRVARRFGRHAAPAPVALRRRRRLLWDPRTPRRTPPDRSATPITFLLPRCRDTGAGAWFRQRQRIAPGESMGSDDHRGATTPRHPRDGIGRQMRPG